MFLAQIKDQIFIRPGYMARVGMEWGGMGVGWNNLKPNWSTLLPMEMMTWARRISSPST